MLEAGVEREESGWGLEDRVESGWRLETRVERVESGWG